MFSVLWLNLFFGWSLSTDIRQAEDMEGWGKEHRVLLYFTFGSQVKVLSSASGWHILDHESGSEPWLKGVCTNKSSILLIQLLSGRWLYDGSARVRTKFLQLCLTLCDLVDSSPPVYSPPDNSPALLCPWGSLGRNTGVCSQALLKGIFLTREWTHISCVSCIVRWILYH